MTRDSDSHTQVTQNDWRSWISARAQELKRNNPSRSKKSAGALQTRNGSSCDDNINTNREKNSRCGTDCPVRLRPFGC
jgi:hypothetical protein